MESTTRSRAKEQRTKSGKEGSGVGHANISIYTYTKTSFFDEKSPTFCHPNCRSQKTLRALQNSDPGAGPEKSKPRPRPSPFPTNRPNFFVELLTTIESLKNSSIRCELLANKCSSTPSKDPHVEKEEYHPKCALTSRHSGQTPHFGWPPDWALLFLVGHQPLSVEGVEVLADGHGRDVQLRGQGFRIARPLLLEQTQDRLPIGDHP